MSLDLFREWLKTVKFPYRDFFFRDDAHFDINSRIYYITYIQCPSGLIKYKFDYETGELESLTHVDKDESEIWKEMS